MFLQILHLDQNIIVKIVPQLDTKKRLDWRKGEGTSFTLAPCGLMHMAEHTFWIKDGRRQAMEDDDITKVSAESLFWFKTKRTLEGKRRKEYYRNEVDESQPTSHQLAIAASSLDSLTQDQINEMDSSTDTSSTIGVGDRQEDTISPASSFTTGSEITGDFSVIHLRQELDRINKLMAARDKTKQTLHPCATRRETMELGGD
jgi:hypothetical protein